MCGLSPGEGGLDSRIGEHRLKPDSLGLSPHSDTSWVTLGKLLSFSVLPTYKIGIMITSSSQNCYED